MEQAKSDSYRKTPGKSSERREFGTVIYDNSAAESNADGKVRGASNGALVRDAKSSIKSIVRGSSLRTPSGGTENDAGAAEGLRRNLELEGSLRRAYASKVAGKGTEGSPQVDRTPRSSKEVGGDTNGFRSGGRSPNSQNRTGPTGKKIKKRAVRARKSPAPSSPYPASALTPASGTPSSSSYRSSSGHSQYTVRFKPGPLGIKLEPIVVNSSPGGDRRVGSEMGCRVVRFVDRADAPSQARTSGLIAVSDVVVAVDRQEVLTWKYGEVIALLKAAPRNEGRVVTFRSVRGTSRSARRSLGRRRKTNRNEDGSASADASGGGETAMCPPDPPSGSLPQPSSTPTAPASRSIPGSASSMASVNLEDDGGPLPRETTSIGPVSSSGMFSPSNVKRLAGQERARSSGIKRELDKVGRNGTNDSATPGAAMKPAQNPKRGILSSVFSQTLLPAASVVYSNVSSTSRMADTAANRIGEALVGHSEKDFKETLRLKMELLSELSAAKAALGADKEARRELESAVDHLKNEIVHVERARSEADDALREARSSEVSLRDELGEKADQLKRLGASAEELTERGAKLEAQNELLREQADQLRGLVAAKEKAAADQLAAGQVELKEREEAVSEMRFDIAQFEKRLRGREEELEEATGQLAAAKEEARGFASLLKAKECALDEAEQSARKLRDEVLALETALAESSQDRYQDLSNKDSDSKTQLDLMRVEMENIRIETEAKLASLHSELAANTETKTLLEKDVQSLKEELVQSQKIELNYSNDLESRMEEISTLKVNFDNQVKELQRRADATAEVWRAKEEKLNAEVEEQRKLSAKAEADLEESVAKFEKELEEVTITKRALEDDVKRLTDDFTESQDSLAESERQASDMTSIQKRLKDQILELQQQLNNSAVELDNRDNSDVAEANELRKMLDAAKHDLAAQEASHAEAMRTLQTRFEAKKEIVNNLNQKNAESTARYENAISNLKEELSCAKAANERGVDLSALQKELAEVLQIKEEVEEELKGLSAQVEAVDKTARERADKIERLQSERDMLRTEKESLAGKLILEADTFKKVKQRQKSELKEAKDESLRTREMFEEKVDSLILEVETVAEFISKEHAKLEAKNEELSFNLAVKEDECSELEEQLKEVEQMSFEEKGNHNVSILELKEELETIRNHCKQAKDKAAENQNQAMISAEQDKIKEILVSLCLVREKRSKEIFDAALYERDERIAGLEEHINKVKDQNATFEDEMRNISESAEAKIAHLIEACEAADMRAEESQVFLDGQTQVIDSIRRSLERACKQLQLTVPHLSSDKSLSNTIAAIAEAASDALLSSESRKTEASKLEEQIIEFRRSLDSAVESLDKSESSQKKMEDQKASSEAQCESLKIELSALKLDLSSKTHEVDQSVKDIAHLRASIITLRSSKAEIEGLLSKEKGEKNGLTNQVKALQIDLSEKIGELERAKAYNQELRAKSSDIDAKDKEIESKELIITELENKISSLDQTISDLESAYGSSAAACKATEARLEESKANAADLEKTNSRLSSDLASKALKLQGVENMLEAQKDALREAREKAECAENDQKATSKDLDYLRSFVMEEGHFDAIEGMSQATQNTVHRVKELKEKARQLALSTQKTMPMTGMNDKLPKDEGSTPKAFTTLLISPSLTTGIKSKHVRMLQDLKDMRKAISLAVSPHLGTPQLPQESDSDNDKLLCSVEKQVGTLVEDLMTTKDELDEKEHVLRDAVQSVGDLENDRDEYKQKLETMEYYTERMEKKLTKELKWRQRAEKELQELRRKVKFGLSDEKQKKEDRFKRAAAKEVALQLEATREKLYLLKSHLREGGLVESEPEECIEGTEPLLGPRSPSTNNSSFWDVSGDDLSDDE